MDNESFQKFFPVERFSKWTDILDRVIPIAFFLKGVEKTPISFLKEMKGRGDYFGASKVAEKLILRQAQLEISESEVQNWNLINDCDGLWRVHARLSNVCAPEKSPIFLPRGGHITKLLIMFTHRNSLHAGARKSLDASSGLC